MKDFSTYQEELEMPEWQKKRNTILDRDGHRCQLCGKGKSSFTEINNVTVHFGINYSSNISKDALSERHFSIAVFKSLFDISKINIYKKDNKLIAITSNGMVGMMNIKDINNIPKADNLIVKLIRVEYGQLSFIITDDLLGNIGDNGLEYGFYISKNPIVLNVHHKQYILGHKAWEYPDTDLVTLCNECHSAIHKTLGAKVYSDEHGYMREILLTPCTKCNGTGYFPEYKHVENGVCFRCRGRRFENYTDNAAEE